MQPQSDPPEFAAPMMDPPPPPSSKQLSTPLLRHTSTQRVHAKAAARDASYHLQRAKDRVVSLCPLLALRVYARLWQTDRKAFWSRLGLDFLAGLTVGAMVVPQAMSFATVAGLQPVFGLYNSFMAILPYPLLGTSPHLVVGPTAVMSIMVKRSIPGALDGGPVSQQLHEYLSFVLAFFVGLWQMVLGAGGLGFLVHLVSEPVITGFTSAAALLIASTQLAALFGVPGCVRNDGNSCTLVDAIKNIDQHSHMIELATPLCSLVAFVFLIVWKRVLARTPAKFVASFGALALMAITIPLAYRLDYTDGWGNKSNTCVLTHQPPCASGEPTIVGQCCTPRNPFREHHFNYNENVKVYDMTWHIRQIGPISPGLPSPYSPFKACTDPITMANGDTERQCVSFQDVKVMLYASVAISLIGYMESMTIAKMIARKKLGSDSCVRPSNELFALGACNMLCSLFQGYPVTGSFSRSAVNGDAGASTSLALMFCGLVVVVSLQFLTPTLAYMPKFTLAAIVLDAVLKLVDIKTPVFLWHTAKRDLAVFVVTFVMVVFVGVEDGLVAGVLLGWAFNLTRVSYNDFTVCEVNGSVVRKPTLARRWSVFHADQAFSEEHHMPAYRVGTLVVRHNLDFANSYRVRDTVQDVLESMEITFLLLDFRNVHICDSTGVHIMDAIVKMCVDEGVERVLVGGITESVANHLMKSARHNPELQEQWEWKQVHNQTNPRLHNEHARLVLFVDVMIAERFASVIDNAHPRSARTSSLGSMSEAQAVPRNSDLSSILDEDPPVA